MAANGHVANPSKTTLLILNAKTDKKVKVKVGSVKVKQEETANLLGVKIEDSHIWTSQINDKGADLQRRDHFSTKQ